jgi:Phage integrase, N-terminal SAM-like domain
MYMKEQQQQGLLRNSSNSCNEIAYRNFVHSSKSERTKAEYIKYLNGFMKWLNVGFEGNSNNDNNLFNNLLQKDPKLIASDIIDYIIYLKNEKQFAPATVSTQIAALHHFYEMNDID